MKPTLFLSVIIFMLLAKINLEARQDTVYFETNKHEVSPRYFKQLNQLAERSLESVDYNIIIRGHTDSIGDDNLNLNLSIRRAQAVKQYLCIRGLDSSKIQTAALGRSMPVCKGSTEFERRRNRRVEVNSTLKDKPGNTLIVFDSLQTENEVFEYDTTIKLPGGVEIFIPSRSFYPRRANEVTFGINRIESIGDAIRRDMMTVDDQGNCLVSGGMFMLSMAIDSSPVTANNALRIRVPVDKVDTSMKLYTITLDSNGNQSWSLTNIPLTYNDKGKPFYEFDFTQAGSYNFDKMPLVRDNAISAWLESFKEDGLVVKTRGFKNGIVYLTGISEFFVNDGTYTRSYFISFDACCGLINNKLVGKFHKDGQYYLIIKPLEELKYSRFFNRYIVRKNDYRSMPLVDIEAEIRNL